MYSSMLNHKDSKTKNSKASEMTIGGYKSSFSVSGNGAYSKLKFENGAHRVQRVPETESVDIILN